MLRNFLRRATGLGTAVRTLFMPWLLLMARIWFGQVIFVHRIMTMAQHADAGAWSGQLHVPSGIDAAVQGVVPLLLTSGLLTRPVALVLLIEMVASSHGAFPAGALGAKFALLAWLVVIGPGAISLDSLLRRGVLWAPFGPVRFMSRCYAWIDRCVSPLVQIVIRVCLAASLANVGAQTFPRLQSAMLGGSASPMIRPVEWAVALAVALAVGCATRPAALIVALMIPLSGIVMSMDDRFAVLLLLLILAASGAGILSVDRLLDWWGGMQAHRDVEAQKRWPHVVVVGGGFGGVAAVRGLRNARCHVTLIDQRNHHLFQPLLYQVATAALSPADIATPIRSLFRSQRNVHVRLGEVTGVDVAAREVLVGAARMKFDYLVLATGARHSYFGKSDWAAFAPGLKSIEDATAMRSRLLRAFEEAENAVNEDERIAWLTFVIVGGGPTGIELAGAIAELARHGMDEEYRLIDPAAARVILVQAGPRVLPTFSVALSGAAERSLRALGVDVRLEAKVLEVDSDGVDVGGQRIPARTVLWAAGVAASAAAQWLGQDSDPSGRLAVGADLSVPGLDAVYAIGDTASCRGWQGAPVPGLAPAAKQQGQYVAKVIAASLAGRRAPPPFRYRHWGSLATIGRQAAVAEIGGVRVWGAPAWWLWGAAHIAFLIGGRNRMTVMLDWLWAYLTYRRSTRIISGGTAGKAPD